MRSMAIAILSLVFAGLPAWAAEIIEYKGAVLIRQEERGFMVFKVKDGEVRAQPSPSMKGIDQNGKVYSSSFEAAEKKEHAYQLLKVGNQFDIKINKVNAKTSYIAEVRLIKGEPLAVGEKNKVEKAGGNKTETKTENNTESKKPASAKDTSKRDETKPADKKPTAKPKEEKHSYAKAIIKSFDGKQVTFKADGEEITAEVPNNFQARDRFQVLKKDERLRVFKEGNEATISTKTSGKKVILTNIRLTRGSLTDK